MSSTSSSSSFKELFGDKRQVQVYTHFDFKCIDSILKAINKKSTSRFNSLINIYKSEYGETNVSTDDFLQRNASQFLESKKTEIENLYTSTSKNSININFIYEQYAPEWKYDHNNKNVKVNIASNNEAIEKDTSKYKMFLKNRFEKVMDDIFTNKTDIGIVFLNKKSNDLYAILQSENNTSPNKKKTFEKGNIPIFLNDTIETFINKTELNFKFIRTEQIVPNWLSIDIFNKKQMTAFINTDEYIKGSPDKDKNDVYQCILFIIQELHKEINLYQEKRPERKVLTTIKNFVIYYNITGFDKMDKDYYFTNDKVFSQNIPSYDYYVGKDKITIEKNQSFTIHPTTKDIELKIQKTETGYDRMYLKLKKLKQGFVFTAKLFNISTQSKNYYGRIYKQKKEINTGTKPLSSKTIYPETKRPALVFFFIPGFFFRLYHIKSFYNKITPNINLNKFIIEVCTNRSKIEEFYLYCLNHEKQSFQETIQLTTENDNSKNKMIVENEVKLMLNKDTLFSLSNRESTSNESGKYISHSVNKMTIDKKNEIQFKTGTIPGITVDIELKAKDTKIEKTEETATDCKTLKKGVLHTIKSWTQKASNTVELWKMDFDTTLKNKINSKTGGNKTKKFRKKKHKKTRRSKRV